MLLSARTAIMKTAIAAACLALSLAAHGAAPQPPRRRHRTRPDRQPGRQHHRRPGRRAALDRGAAAGTRLDPQQSGLGARLVLPRQGPAPPRQDRRGRNLAQARPGPGAGRCPDPQRAGHHRQQPRQARSGHRLLRARPQGGPDPAGGGREPGRGTGRVRQIPAGPHGPAERHRTRSVQQLRLAYARHGARKARPDAGSGTGLPQGAGTGAGARKHRRRAGLAAPCARQVCLRAAGLPHRGAAARRRPGRVARHEQFDGLDRAHRRRRQRQPARNPPRPHLRRRLARAGVCATCKSAISPRP